MEPKNKNEEIEDVFAMTNADGEDSFDLNAILNSQNNNESTENTVIENKPKEKELTPLERMKRSKEKENSGMIIGNEELEEGKITGPSKDVVFNDKRLEEFDDYSAEVDETIQRTKYVNIIHTPTNEAERAKMMLEIDSVRISPNGKPYFDYKDPQTGEKLTPEYVTLASGDDFPKAVKAKDWKSIKSDRNTVDQTLTVDDLPSKIGTEEYDEEAEDDEKLPVLTEDQKRNIKIIIDKTGMGIDFKFTEEEQKKILHSSTIEINEVKKIDINTIKDKRSDKTFSEIISQYDYSGSKTPIYFPASGFKCQMKGLSYGEYADLALILENPDIEAYRRRLTVIYNKMTNISIGEFESFDDFLKKFCSVDLNLAIYALFIATEPEEQEVQLKCGNPRCRKDFDWKFNARSIIRLDRCGDTFIEKMTELIKATPDEYQAIHDRSAVMNSQFIQMPKSKFIVELGLASAYEYLYNIVPFMNQDTYKQTFGERINDMNIVSVLLLSTIRSIRIPDGDSYVVCENYKDIIDAIYNISAEEIAIINTYVAKLQEMYKVDFALLDVTCPHCQHVTKSIPMDLDNMVFQAYQRLMSTEVELKNMLDS